LTTFMKKSVMSFGCVEMLKYKASSGKFTQSVFLRR
jgi:hypothetical protein